MVFLKVRLKKGKKPFEDKQEGYVDDRFFNIASEQGGLKVQIYKDQSFDNPLGHYFAEDLEIID